MTFISAKGQGLSGVPYWPGTWQQIRLASDSQRALSPIATLPVSPESHSSVSRVTTEAHPEEPRKDRGQIMLQKRTLGLYGLVLKLQSLSLCV